MRNKNSRIKRRQPPALLITSLLDAFTILLLFLLKSFSAESDVITVSPDLMLPESSAQKEGKSQRVTVAVSRLAVSVSGEPVLTLKEIEEIDDVVIHPLLDVLEERREEEIQMVQIGAALKFEGKIVLQIDSKVPYKIILKVMQTCGQAGFINMNLAVIKSEEEV